MHLLSTPIFLSYHLLMVKTSSLCKEKPYNIKSEFRGKAQENRSALKKAPIFSGLFSLFSNLQKASATPGKGAGITSQKNCLTRRHHDGITGGSKNWTEGVETMRFFAGMRFIGLFSIFAVCLGCASGSVKQKEGPTVSDAQAVSATGPKARIAVAQFVNNSGSPEDRQLREMLRRSDEAREDARHMMEYQKKWLPYMLEVQYWQEKLAAEGPEAAGPPPEPPEDMPSSSPYTVTVADPVAAGIRDMMINAIFNSGKFIVLEREAIDKINWEQEFSASGLVGEKTCIPAGEIEGAELLLIGSLNTCEAKTSGGSLAGIFDSATAELLGLPYTTETTEGGVSWENAKVAMELRLVDTRTSRVVAATTVQGTARSVLFGARKTQYSWNAGALPSGFSYYQNTPVEAAFRKMIDATVEFLVTKTPEKYYHR